MKFRQGKTDKATHSTFNTITRLSITQNLNHVLPGLQTPSLIYSDRSSDDSSESPVREGASFLRSLLHMHTTAAELQHIELPRSMTGGARELLTVHNVFPLQTYLPNDNLKFAYVIMCFLPSVYQHGRDDNMKSCILYGERLLYLHATLSRNGICDVK